MFKLNASVITGKTASLTASTYDSAVSNLWTDFSTKVLEGMVSDTSDKSLNALYREMYLYDTVSGPAVDLLSTLPWSPCSIHGVSDPKVQQLFEESLDEIGIIDLMTRATVSYLVLGSLVGSLLFNEQRGIFTDVIIHDPDDCIITPIPLRGYDPKIDLKISPNFKKFLRSNDQRDKEALKEIPPAMLSKLMAGGKIPLEPLSTLYVSRSNVPGIESMSYYTRILPLWLMEKALMRGTILGSWRRQRPILHVTCGTDEWEATDAQMAAIRDMFIQADRDPQGAVLVTRPGLEVNEIRTGSDFWRYSDESDLLTTAKMRALGISESFLSGEANYSTMEISLSIFMDHLKSLRDRLTQAIIIDKICLMLAKYHGFRKRTEAEITHGVRYDEKSNKYLNPYKEVRMVGAKNLAEANTFITPQIKWSKDLTARSDQSYMDMLQSVKEKGVPVPLTLFAAAAGLRKNEIIASLDEDIDFRKEIKAYDDKLKKEGLVPQEQKEDMYASYGVPSETVLTPSDAVNLIIENNRRLA